TQRNNKIVNGCRTFLFFPTAQMRSQYTFKQLTTMKKPLLLQILLAFTLFTFGQNGENFKIIWPEEYKWKVGSNQENDKQHMIEMIPGNETIDKWTIIGTMLTIKGVQNVPMEVAMNLMFD